MAPDWKSAISIIVVLYKRNRKLDCLLRVQAEGFMFDKNMANREVYKLYNLTLRGAYLTIELLKK